MINPKYICISAAVGFVLSFVVGIFSNVAFFNLLIRALIYAAVFAFLSAAIIYLSKTFLVFEQTLDSSANDENSSSVKNQAGNLINIVVDDSTLRDDSSAPRFSVANPGLFGEEALAEEKKQEASKKSAENSNLKTASFDKIDFSKEKSELAKEKPAAPKISAVKNISESLPGENKSKENSQGAFVSADLSALTSNSASQKNLKENNSENEDSSPRNENLDAADSLKNSAAQNENQEDSGIDDLPDIGGLDLSGSSGAGIMDDTDFSSGASSSLSAAADTGGQDADTMAQAIRTMLANDNQ